MVIDARSIDDGAEIACDVCIVGAGAAGITIARELDARGRRVCLLESGGLAPETRTQSMYEGESVGSRYKVEGAGPEDTLQRSRLRYFGGTTNHWGGWCRPFDEIDFEERPGVPDSGWPIDRAQLEPYYERAHEVCRLGPVNYEAAYWARLQRKQPLPLERPVANEVYQVSGRPRFGQLYGGSLRRSRRVRLILHGNAIGFRVAGDGDRIDRVRAATLTGRRFDVRARDFVLATGGIENARLLLASNDLSRRGVGNERDLVGRYFADHPHAIAAFVALRPGLDLAFYTSPQRITGTTVLGAIATDQEFARSEGLLRFSATVFEAPRFELPGELSVAPPPLADGVPALLQAEAGGRGGGLLGGLFMRTEMAPNRNSRVTLSRAKDALGLPRARVDWRLGELERRTVERSVEAIARAFGESGIGRVSRAPADDERFWEKVAGGSHHIGTTRMHTDPGRGVVDANCRVHGVANLFVAGSSVFPTTGFSNPTLTIVALALRLADHLKRASS